MLNKIEIYVSLFVFFFKQKTAYEIELEKGLSSDFLFGGDEGFSSKPSFTPSKEEQRIFGFSLFNSEHLSFKPSVNYPVTDAYVVGVGDELRVDVYGASQQSYVMMVDNTGQIRIPDVDRKSTRLNSSHVR